MALKASLIAFGLLFGLSTAASAQDTAPDLPASDNPSEEIAVLNDFIAGTNRDVSAIHFADMDQDGRLEAMVSYPDDCNSLGCLFAIVDDFNTGVYQVAAYQYGEKPEIIYDGAVIDASGAYWTWDGRTLQPYGNALLSYTKESGTVDDVEAIEAVDPWRKDLSRFKIDAYLIDLIGDKRLERVLYVKSLAQASGQAYPFYILDADGHVVDSDYALELPFFHTRTDRKAAQYSFSYGDGFRVKMIE